MHETVVTQPLQSLTSAGRARYFSVLLIIVLGLATSCQDDGDTEPSVKESVCRVLKQTTNARVYLGSPDEYSYTAVFSYEYDDKRNKIAENVQYNNTYKNGKKSSSTSNSSFQYDAEGFLLRSVRQYNDTGIDGVASNSSTNEEFTYENGRLTKAAITATDAGKQSGYVRQYEYDGTGKLIKFSNTYNNTSLAITYNGNIVQKITITDGAGTVTSPFLQYNDKGWLTKSIEDYGGGNDEFRYEYTADGQVAREERYINGKPSSGTIYEYDNRENPDRYRYARPKGHPLLPSSRPDFLSIHNITRVTSLQSNDDGTGFKNRGSTVYVYDYNEQGFPTGYTLKTTNVSGIDNDTATIAYEYIGCD